MCKMGVNEIAILYLVIREIICSVVILNIYLQKVQENTMFSSGEEHFRKKARKYNSPEAGMTFTMNSDEASMERSS